MSRLGPGDADLHHVGGSHKSATGMAPSRSARHERRLMEHLRHHEYVDEMVGATVGDEDEEQR